MLYIIIMTAVELKNVALYDYDYVMIIIGTVASRKTSVSFLL